MPRSSEREVDSDHERVLVCEMQHRLKNTLAMI